MRLMIGLGLAISVACASVVVAQQGVPRSHVPGPVTLNDVLELARPYPNLVFEIRAELVRAGLRRDDVVCDGWRFGADWGRLVGARSQPYDCRIGRRTLVVSARQTFYDANGHKLAGDDPQLRRRAARLVESGLQWRWR